MVGDDKVVLGAESRDHVSCFSLKWQRKSQVMS